MKNLYLKLIYSILAYYSRTVLKKHHPVIIAITGSVGKTTTKESIYQVLSSEYGHEVRKNYGNLNAELGIPLTILGYDKIPNKYLWPFFLVAAAFKLKTKRYPKYLVLEMGVEKKGDIEYFTSIAKPNYAVITSTEPAHIQNFKDLAEFREEKFSIASKVQESGKVILNLDDDYLKKQSGDNFVSFSLNNENADYRAENIKVSVNGTEYRIVCTGYKIAVKSKLLGRHLVNSQLAAFAIADQLGISRMKIGKSLEKIEPIKGRMNIIDGVNETIIIDDTYNSNPTSAKAAIDIVSDLHYSYRKIVVFGNMNELGKLSEEKHREIAEYMKGKFDFALFSGPNSDLMVKSFGESGKAKAFKNRLELIHFLAQIIKPKDLILIKASQNKNFFEEVTKSLMKNPKEAHRVLVRQDNFWKNKKNYQ